VEAVDDLADKVGNFVGVYDNLLAHQFKFNYWAQEATDTLFRFLNNRVNYKLRDRGFCIYLIVETKTRTLIKAYIQLTQHAVASTLVVES